MSWRDRIAELLMRKRPDITTVPPAPMRWPPDLGPVDPAAPRASSNAYLVTEPGAGLKYNFGDAPPMGMPARQQGNRPTGDVLPFDERWPK